MNILAILALLCLLGSIVCWIIVLIKMFQNGGALMAILGFICSLWAFIWGWMNSGRLGFRNIMYIWTALLVLYFILIMAAGGMGAMPGMPTANTP
ncbi:MAG TPA: hypothetical protein VE842_10365 [Pyrinomonadaceae bacterium]|jgi:hypothetical protein|nr:hypothetical protein [Pyrinomonadaceae bacterium]